MGQVRLGEDVIFLRGVIDQEGVGVGRRGAVVVGKRPGEGFLGWRIVEGRNWRRCSSPPAFEPEQFLSRQDLDEQPHFPRLERASPAVDECSCRAEEEVQVVPLDYDAVLEKVRRPTVDLARLEELVHLSRRGGVVRPFGWRSVIAADRCQADADERQYQSSCEHAEEEDAQLDSSKEIAVDRPEVDVSGL